MLMFTWFDTTCKSNSKKTLQLYFRELYFTVKINNTLKFNSMRISKHLQQSRSRDLQAYIPSTTSAPIIPCRCCRIPFVLLCDQFLPERAVIRETKQRERERDGWKVLSISCKNKRTHSAEIEYLFGPNSQWTNWVCFGKTNMNTWKRSQLEEGHLHRLVVVIGAWAPTRRRWLVMCVNLPSASEWSSENVVG